MELQKIKKQAHDIFRLKFYRKKVVSMMFASAVATIPCSKTFRWENRFRLHKEQDDIFPFLFFTAGIEGSFIVRVTVFLSTAWKFILLNNKVSLL
jgi:hypothetical protein